jgi:hypothetical protein
MSTLIMAATVLKTTKALAVEARSFLSKLAGPAFEEAGLLLQDEVRLWRFRNQVRILARAREILGEATIVPCAVPFRTLAPILEGAALEDDPGLSEKWACLLANAGGQTGVLTSHPAFPRMLAEITPGEASFLDRLSAVGGKDRLGRFSEGYRPTSQSHRRRC